MQKLNKNEEEKLNLASAKDLAVKGSVYKIKLVSDLIVKKKVSEALLQLKFCNRRVSNTLLKILNSAIANAENNHGMDIDNLVVKEVRIGKSLVLKRFRARARGRGNRILKPVSRIEVVVQEVVI